MRSDPLSPQVKSRESAYRLRCDQRQKSLLQPHRLDHMTRRFNLQPDVELPSAAKTRVVKCATRLPLLGKCVVLTRDNKMT